MPDHARLPALISLLRARCPQCREGRVFTQPGILPLSTCLRMHDDCPVCNYRLKGEANNGPGINYALTVFILFGNLAWYWPIFGISYKDNSLYYFLATSIAIVVILQPWLMRLSRMIYLYLVRWSATL